MTLLLVALGALSAGGLLALLCGRRPRLAAVCGAAGPIVALVLALLPTLDVLTGAPPLSLSVPSSLPLVTLRLGLDALSAFFLLLILGLAALAATYGVGYLPREASWRGPAAWAFFNLLVASLAAVVLARNAVVFLVAWETMSLSSFFLVAHDHDRREVRQAAWTYLVATHLGSLFLIPMFLLLAGDLGTLNFDAFGQALAPGAATACFLLALVGFGTKAGLMPFHVWLPEAHPVAPSHVSALLSGVMIKMGIYGLLRVLTFLGDPPLWWGWLLVLLGASSALFGVLLALAQHDLKRLLAYSSVENIGVIVLSLGVGVTGLASDAPRVAALGFAGALFHTLSHALFKGLLFLGAGAVLHATGTTALDALGGLAQRMPHTALAVLVGCLALCALPPTCGFAGELLILLGLIDGIAHLPASGAVPLALGTAVLAAVSALALAAASLVFGIPFLGQPRSEAARRSHEPATTLGVPLLLLAIACVAVGFAGAWLAPALTPVVRLFVANPTAPLAEAGAFLGRVNLLAGVLLTTIVVLALVRRALLRRREVREAVTWDCGYSAPRATMQYTASSFAQPIVDMYGSLLRTRKRVESPEIHFPDAARVETETPDFGREEIYEPLFEGIERAVGRIHILQHGRVQVYVLGVVLTLLTLLLWQVR